MAGGRPLNLAALLDDLTQRGVDLTPLGERLRYRGPADVLTPEVLAELRAHKPVVLAALNARIAQRWGDAAEAVAWFLRTEPPSEPFVPRRNPMGQPFVTVLHPERYWRALMGDLAAGPGTGRDTYGAVRADVLRLYELFGGAA